MRLTHPKFGETHTDSEQEARRLAQYGWVKAKEKTSRKRKPAEEQPELPTVEALSSDSE